MESSRKRAGIEGSGRFIELLLQSGEVLGESLDYHETLQNVCAAAVQTIADICMIDIFDASGEITLLAAAHRQPDRSMHLMDAAAKFRKPSPGFPPYIGALSAKSEKPILVEMIDETYLMEHATSLEHRGFMREMGYRSMVVAPLVSKRYGTLGSLTVVRTDPLSAPFDVESVVFVKDLARRCATAISKAMLHEQTLEIATRFQRAALPKFLPNIPGFDLDAFYEPASAEQLVGGDWYDAFETGDDCVAITIGDVQGHGVEAAVLMNSMRDALRAALYGGSDLAEALAIGDRIMSLEGEGSFATAVVASLKVSERRLTVASAGHPGPLIWKDGERRVIDPFLDRSLPMGMQRYFKAPQLAATSVVLQPCDFVLFFTDGLIEWKRDMQQGMERLETVMADPAMRRSSQPAMAIRRMVLTGPIPDDVAILTLRAD